MPGGSDLLSTVSAATVSENGEITNLPRASRSADRIQVPTFRLLANHYELSAFAMHDLPVPTYRSLFGIREFRVLFLNRCVVMISVSASALALGTVTYDVTGSAVLTGLSMFGGPLIALVASQLLLASSDFVRPRTALEFQMAAPLLADALQCVPGMPWQLRFLLLAIPYVVNSMFSGTQWVIVRDIVPGASFILARSTMNLAVGGMQVVGYGVGGLVLLWLSPRGLFLVAAIADLLSLINVRFGIRDRPARARGGQAGTGARTVVRRTAEVNRRLLASRMVRPLYLALWIPNGLIVGCESLFVPYGHSGPGHGPIAGYLFAATAAGMMTGDLIIGRFVPPGRRDKLIEPLRLLLAVPYVFLLVSPPYWIVVVLGFTASFGYSAALPLSERLVSRTDDNIHGQVMGLYSQGVSIWQSFGALIAGAVAAWVPPGRAIGVMAVASITATLVLVAGLRRSAPGRFLPAVPAPVPPTVPNVVSDELPEAPAGP
jgi:MFS family permease